jgi:hypothetical protein
VKELIFVVGLSGIGKSYYIDRVYPHAYVIDYEVLRRECLEAHPTMDHYEVSAYVKSWAMDRLAVAIASGTYRDIVIECTGMSKVQQAAMQAMMDYAETQGYESEVVYLKPADWHQFYHHIEGDEQALGMYLDYSRGGPRWREPDRCPYFQNVTVLEVQRDDLEDYHEDLETRLAAERGVL